MKEQISKMASIPREYGGRPWYWNDMDMLQTGNGPQSGYDATFPPPNMTLEECERATAAAGATFPPDPRAFLLPSDKTEFSMWAIAASVRNFD